MSELLEDTPSLPEEEPVFQSSGIAFEVKSEDGHPVLRMIGIFVFVICALGFANGLDFINPESGLVRPHEWINGMAQGAPHDSAEFSGTITSDGEPLVNATVLLEHRNADGIIDVPLEAQTDEDGFFQFTGATPGLTSIEITRYNDDGKNDAVRHRLILNPPSPLEQTGFTTIDFDFPATSEFSEVECKGNYANGSCVRLISYFDEQMDFPLLDQSAAGLYIMIGWAMIGLALISAGFAFFGIKKGSRGMIQTSCVLVFFTAGHYYSACLFSVMAFALTFTVPRKSIILDA
ncbi:MAG: hypothetical protein CMB76_00880 [Euryarchaeota archaeon]|nr:hypothetical protein [Euryarchaeota archaeon]|tara:strand:- start:1003 stop:1875 length:873 start_codon:yes stop_codon:yes gene_type:complete